MGGYFLRNRSMVGMMPDNVFSMRMTIAVMGTTTKVMTTGTANVYAWRICVRVTRSKVTKEPCHRMSTQTTCSNMAVTASNHTRVRSENLDVTRSTLMCV